MAVLTANVVTMGNVYLQGVWVVSVEKAEKKAEERGFDLEARCRLLLTSTRFRQVLFITSVIRTVA